MQIFAWAFNSYSSVMLEQIRNYINVSLLFVNIILINCKLLIFLSWVVHDTDKLYQFALTSFRHCWANKAKPSRFTVYRPLPHVHVFRNREKFPRFIIPHILISQISLCLSSFHSKNHGVRDKWNDGMSVTIIQNSKQAFKGFYKVSENAKTRRLIAT